MTASVTIRFYSIEFNWKEREWVKGEEGKSECL